MARNEIRFVLTGDKLFDKALNLYGDKRIQRRMVNGPSRDALKILLPAVKANNIRQHALSMNRAPFDQRKGNMWRYVNVRNITGRSSALGAKLGYNVKKHPGFIVTSKRGKRYNYAALQDQYGAKKGGRVLFRAKNSQQRAIDSLGQSAADKFRSGFIVSSEQVMQVEAAKLGIAQRSV